MDDALAHQRGEADRRPAVVGEHQERAGIGNDAAMQRHAVHRGSHAVLADAVVDVAAAEIGGRDRLHALGARVVGAGEVGRTADHLRQRRDQAFERKLAGRARRESFGVAASFSFTARMAASSACCGISPRMRRSNSARLRHRARRAASSSPRAAACERAPAARQASRISAGTSNGADVQPSFLRAPAISSAPRASRAISPMPAFFGAPKPIVVLQAISDGLCRNFAPSPAPAMAAGSARRCAMRSSRRPRSARPDRR